MLYRKMNQVKIDVVKPDEALKMVYTTRAPNRHKMQKEHTQTNKKGKEEEEEEEWLSYQRPTSRTTSSNSEYEYQMKSTNKVVVVSNIEVDSVAAKMKSKSPVLSFRS